MREKLATPQTEPAQCPQKMTAGNGRALSMPFGESCLPRNLMLLISCRARRTGCKRVIIKPRKNLHYQHQER
jgi:hypothetical protein